MTNCFASKGFPQKSGSVCSWLKAIAITAWLALLLSPSLLAQLPDRLDPNANNYVRDILVQPDGKILISGNFTALSPNG